MEILADKLRPKKISEVIGQKHLIGSGKILTNLVNNKRLFSMILYGKPGIGKTSIANALVSELELRYKFMNATINNKNDFDVAIAEAKIVYEPTPSSGGTHLTIRCNNIEYELGLLDDSTGLIQLSPVMCLEPQIDIWQLLDIEEYRSYCPDEEIKEMLQDIKHDFSETNNIYFITPSYYLDSKMVFYEI